jgi:hypothetical protein
MSSRRVVLALLAAGCSAGSDTPPPGGDDAPPGETGHLSFETACAPITSLAFPATSPGQTATLVVFAINDSTSDVTLGSATELAHVDGADAAEFGVDVLSFAAPFSDPDAAFNCLNRAVLPPHAWCQLALQYTPTAAGTHQASYSLADGAGVLPLTGTAVAQSATVHADQPEIALGFVSRAQGSGPHANTNFAWSQPFSLVNGSGSAISTSALAVDDPFLLDKTACPGTLAAGAMCQAKLALPAGPIPGLPAEIADCTTGHLTGSGLDLPVTYSPAPAPFPSTFHVLPMGNGSGMVTSTSPSLSCNLGGGSTSSCTVTLWDAPSAIQLEATPTNGSGLGGWFRFGDSLQLPCGASSTCSADLVPPFLFGPTNTAVQAWFTAPTDTAVHITIVGTGDVAGAAICNTSCTLYAAPGTTVDLLETTSGTFVGWSGDCSGKSNCSLGAVSTDKTVTATFSP